MDDPAYIVLQRNGRFAEVVRYRNKGGKTLIAALDYGENKNSEYMNGYNGGNYNVIVTTYNPTNLNSYLDTCQAIVFDKTKDTPQSGSGRVEWPSHLNGMSSENYDITSSQEVNREIEEPRYLQTAEEIEAGRTYRTDGEGRQSYGRSFDELVDEVRPAISPLRTSAMIIPCSRRDGRRTHRTAWVTATCKEL